MNIDQIAMFYVSMDLSQRTLQTNGKLFFKFVLKFLAETEKYSKEKRGMNIHQIAMCHISMDSSQRALQTKGKYFPILNFLKFWPKTEKYSKE